MILERSRLGRGQHGRALGRRTIPLGPQDADNAVDAIRRRLAADETPATAAQQTKSAAPAATPSADPEFRIWHDATGTFEVEAAMVSYENKTVSLKRKDGKIVPVPFEKLSKADQQYLTEHAKSANPFD